MRGHSGLLSPRQGPKILDDLAERTAFVAGQRVRGRRRGRARRRSSPRVRWLAAGVAMAVLVGGVAAHLHWLLTSPRFAVRHVEIQGLAWLRDDEVRAAAGIEPGQNLFAVDEVAVARRLEQLPRIKRARVVRGLPDRVVLAVEERTPFALVVRAGRLYWVDEAGHLLGPEPRAVVPRLPVITGLTTGGESRPATDGAEVQSATALLRMLLRAGGGLATRLSEIHVGRADAGPVLYTEDGIEVRLGRDWTEEELGRLDGVVAQLRAEPEPVESIDLRFRDQVVLKLKR